jgi:hypothetical protein
MGLLLILTKNFIVMLRGEGKCLFSRKYWGRTKSASYETTRGICLTIANTLGLYTAAKTKKAADTMNISSFFIG